MSEQMTPPRGRLREHVAEEIRVLLARRKMSGAELARRTGIKQSTMSRRMTGETAFDMDDLEAIATALEIEVSDLIPRKGTEVSGDFDQASADRFVTVGQGSVARPEGVTPVSESRKPPRPIRQQKPGHTRPVSAVPARKRRPAPVRPGGPGHPSAGN
jgi:transcriptional regulator with XRE-family HTH domain